MSSVGEERKREGDIRSRTQEVRGSKITHVIHSAACTLGSRVATHTYSKPLGTIFCQERLPSVWLFWTKCEETHPSALLVLCHICRNQIYNQTKLFGVETGRIRLVV